MSVEKISGKLHLKFNDNLQDVKEEIKQLEELRRELFKSREYESLDGKTQTISGITEKKERSRKEHSKGVRGIACRILYNIYNEVCDEEFKATDIYKYNLEKELLYTEITALAHDIGHTPFGHTGEFALNEFMKSINDKNEKDIILRERKEVFGSDYERRQGHNDGYNGRLSFEHNEESALIFNRLMKNSEYNLNMIDKQRIIQGILAHSTSRVKEEYIPNDLVAQIIRHSDKIEFSNLDFEELKDCFNLDYMAEHKPKLSKYIKISCKDRINKTIYELAEETIKKGKIDDHMKSLKMIRELKDYKDQAIYFVDIDGQRHLLKNENANLIQELTYRLAKYYYENPDEMINFNWVSKPLNQNKEKVIIDGRNLYSESKAQRVIEYVAQMDNEFFKKTCQIYLKNNKIEPPTMEDVEIARGKELKRLVNQESANVDTRSDDEVYGIVVNGINDLKYKVFSQKGRERIEKNSGKNNEMIKEIRKIYEAFLSKRKVQERVNENEGNSKKNSNIKEITGKIKSDFANNNIEEYYK